MESRMASAVPDELHPRDAYRLMNSVVAPRPIAWVSTISAEGAANLAPFSFFNGVSPRPPTIMFSVTLRPGQMKDTLRNVQETREFVVNMVDESLAEAMNQTSGEWAPDVDEFKLARLDSAPSMDVRPPRVAAAPAALECRVTQIIPVEGSLSTMVLGRVVRFHFREGLLRSDWAADPQLLRPVARLGRDEYTTLGQVFSMVRPKSPEHYQAT